MKRGNSEQPFLSFCSFLVKTDCKHRHTVNCTAQISYREEDGGQHRGLPWRQALGCGIRCWPPASVQETKMGESWGWKHWLTMAQVPP